MDTKREVVTAMLVGDNLPREIDGVAMLRSIADKELVAGCKYV